MAGTGTGDGLAQARLISVAVGGGLNDVVSPEFNLQVAGSEFRFEVAAADANLKREL